MALSQNGLVILSRAGINAKTTGTTIIDVTENGTRRFHLLWVALVCTAATSITAGGVYSVGTNASTYNDLIGAPTWIGAVATHDVFIPTPLSAFPSVAANTEIRVNVQTAATGTSMTVRVDLIGNYV